MTVVERAILFSGPMVRAILDGRKTMTRRVVKLPRWDQGCNEDHEFEIDDGVPYAIAKRTGCLSAIECPYGQAGDRLWVKEGWAQEHPLAVQEGRYSQEGRAGIPGPPGVTYRVVYRADGEPLQVWRNADQRHPYFTLDRPTDETAAKYPTVSSNFKRDGKLIYWDNARFMPRWASRIKLELTGVRVEQLHAISGDDAKAEGSEYYVAGEGLVSESALRIEPGYWHGIAGYRTGFEVLWDDINGKRAPWASNPFVWVLTFKRLSAAIKE